MASTSDHVEQDWKIGWREHTFNFRDSTKVLVGWDVICNWTDGTGGRLAQGLRPGHRLGHGRGTREERLRPRLLVVDRLVLRRCHPLPHPARAVRWRTAYFIISPGYDVDTAVLYPDGRLGNYIKFGDARRRTATGGVRAAYLPTTPTSGSRDGLRRFAAPALGTRLKQFIIGLGIGPVGTSEWFSIQTKAAWGLAQAMTAWDRVTVTQQTPPALQNTIRKRTSPDPRTVGGATACHGSWCQSPRSWARSAGGGPLHGAARPSTCAARESSSSSSAGRRRA